MYKLVFILFCALVAVHSVSAQDDILEDFDLVQTGNSIIANFSIRGGASCQGVTLQRRLEGDSDYHVAAEIQGVCGGSEFTEFYSMEDSAPQLGQENIYRLKLGSQGFSDEIRITVIELSSDYKVYPQPSADQIFVKFENPNSEEVLLSVYDSTGKSVVRKDAFTRDIIFINAASLRSGIYIFQIEFSSSKIISGKFLRS